MLLLLLFVFMADVVPPSKSIFTEIALTSWLVPKLEPVTVSVPPSAGTSVTLKILGGA